MKLRNSVVLFGAMFLALSTPAVAQTDEHAEQHRRIEEKLNRVMELLEEKSTAKAEAPSDIADLDAEPSKTQTSEPKSDASEYKNGPLVDVHVLTGFQDGPIEATRRFPDTASRIALPASRSFGTMRAEGSLFAYDAYLQDDAFKSLSRKPIGLNWRGYLMIPDDDVYTLAIELVSQPHNRFDYGIRFPACTAELSVENKSVLSIFQGTKAIANAWKEEKNQARASAAGVLAVGSHNAEDIGVGAGTWTEQKDFELKAGYYRTSFWVACVAVDPALIKPALKIRGPADRVLRVVTETEFLHKGR